MAPVYSINWMITKEEERSNKHNQEFRAYLERSEIRSQQRLQISRLSDLDDQELEAIATAAARELRNRRLQKEEVVEAGRPSGQRGQLVLGCRE